MSLGSSPFRDLFVELPRAVFDALHAWGEAAIVKAQAPTVPAPRPRIPTVLDRTTLLAWRYGWREAESRRLESDHATEIMATLGCGHVQRYYVSDLVLLMAPGPAWQLGVLDRVVDNTPRGCFCVQREA